MEISMNNQSDRDTIAEEAVGQRRDGAPSYAVKEEMSEEAVRRIAQSAGAAASIPEKTAESVGENLSQVRVRFFAEGRWIRTIGSAPR
jgi:hypothetical protein